MMDVVAHMRDWPWHFPMTEPVLVGVSGGVDSMVLVGALVRAGWTGVVVVHVNHQLRGEAAEADEELVRNWAGRHGCGFEVVRAGVAARAGGRAPPNNEACIWANPTAAAPDAKEPAPITAPTEGLNVCSTKRSGAPRGAVMGAPPAPGGAAPTACAEGITELIEATTTPRVCGFLYWRLPPPLPRW